MSKESDEYEEFIASIIKDVQSTGRNIEILCYGRDCKLLGESGQPHQIDVAFVDHDTAPSTLVLVECKLKGTRNAGPEVPKVAWFNQVDIDALKEHAGSTVSIIVTSCGWSSGAERISDWRQLRREVVPFKVDAYTFRYNEIVMGYATERLGFGDACELEIVRDGKSLGKGR